MKVIFTNCFLLEITINTPKLRIKIVFFFLKTRYKSLPVVYTHFTVLLYIFYLLLIDHKQVRVYANDFSK